MLGFEQSRFVVLVAKKSKCLKLFCGKIILRKPFAVCVRHRILPNQLVSHRGDKDFYLLLVNRRFTYTPKQTWSNLNKVSFVV